MPTQPPVTTATCTAFCLIVAVVAAIWPVLTWRALGPRAARIATLVVAVWLAVCWWLGVERTLLPVDGRMPPPFAKVIVPTTLAVLTLGLSPLGRRLATGVPLAWLLLIQSFRLPLELVMAQLAAEGALPPQMTLHGWNFDILSGVLGLLLGLWALRRPLPSWLVAAYNAMGLGFLITVVSIAVRSAPGPLAAWPDLPRNTLVF